MTTTFSTNYSEILAQINAVHPIKYAKTRNFINGDVTYLSPYISRGVISTKQILDITIQKGYSIYEMEKFVQELAWRDYYQRVWQHKGSAINADLKNTQTNISHHQTPTNLIAAKTRIDAIDTAVTQLYQTGYMHNHCRMYTAALACNIAKAHWHNPAQWLYYNLLDGDWASNALSWQWVAGAFSSKKYYANQENISKYTLSNQKRSYLNIDYHQFDTLQIPDELAASEKFIATTNLPIATTININNELPTLIYNYYNLDPQWRSTTPANRVLLLEPEIFNQYPVNNNCINFMLNLAKNIDGIQIYVGSFNQLKTTYNLNKIYYKEHPLNNYSGIEDQRDWISNDIKDYYPSFFGYWKKLERQLKK